jgi:hypothetical protein
MPAAVAGVMTERLSRGGAFMPRAADGRSGAFHHGLLVVSKDWIDRQRAADRDEACSEKWLRGTQPSGFGVLLDCGRTRRTLTVPFSGRVQPTQTVGRASLDGIDVTFW